MGLDAEDQSTCTVSLHHSSCELYGHELENRLTLRSGWSMLQSDRGMETGHSAPPSMLPIPIPSSSLGLLHQGTCRFGEGVVWANGCRFIPSWVLQDYWQSGFHFQKCRRLRKRRWRLTICTDLITTQRLWHSAGSWARIAVSGQMSSHKMASLHKVPPTLGRISGPILA